MAITSHLTLSDPDTNTNGFLCSGSSSMDDDDDDECDSKNEVGAEEYREKLLTTLRSLRALVPKGRGSLAEDTVAYVQQLKDGIENIKSEIHDKIVSSQRALLANMANRPTKDKVKVEMKDSGLEIQVECEKRPGLALALSKAIDDFKLIIIQASMACQSRIGFYVLSEKMVGGVIVDPEHLKSILQQTISTYTRSPIVGTQ